MVLYYNTVGNGKYNMNPGSPTSAILYSLYSTSEECSGIFNGKGVAEKIQIDNIVLWKGVMRKQDYLLRYCK